MIIVGNTLLYTTKMITVYDVDKGLETIKEYLIKAKKARFITVPMNIIYDNIPILNGKDVKIILPFNEKIPDQLKNDFNVKIARFKNIAEYKGEEVIEGDVILPSISFTILWKDNRIYDINATNYEKCIRCLGEFFEDSNWRTTIEL